jgi:hypothetical protein
LFIIILAPAAFPLFRAVAVVLVVRLVDTKIAKFAIPFIILGRSAFPLLQKLSKTVRANPKEIEERTSKK